MIATESQKIPQGITSALGQQRIHFQLRSRGGGDRILASDRLKFTIGADPACAIRLVPDEHVRPVHCFVLRGRAGTVVRCWSDNTRLNGQPFSDAWLRVGDVLQIGGHGLELLPDVSAGHAASQQPIGPARDTSLVPALFRAESAGKSAIESQLSDTTEDNHQLREQIFSLQEQHAQYVSSLHREQQHLIDSCRTALRGYGKDVPASVQNDARELLVLILDVVNEFQSRISMTDRLHDNLSGREDAIALRENEIEARWKELDTKFQELLVTQERLTADKLLLDNAYNEFEERVETWRREKTVVQSRDDKAISVTSENKLNADSFDATGIDEYLDWKLRLAITGAGDEYDPVRIENMAATPPLAAEEISFSQPRSEAPVDVTSIISRFAPHIQDEGEEQTTRLGHPPTPTLSSESRTPPPLVSGKKFGEQRETISKEKEDEDAAVETYMSQLLQRVGGQAPQKSQVRAIGKTSPAEKAPDVTPSATLQFLERRQEIVPRNRPPLLDLNSMRTLANETAKSAIDRHSRSIRRRQEGFRWLAAVCCFLVAGNLLFWSKQLGITSRIGAGILGVVGVYLGIQGVSRNGKFPSRTRKRSAGVPKVTVDTSPTNSELGTATAKTGSSDHPTSVG